MKRNGKLICFLKDFFAAYGCLMAVVSICLGISLIEAISVLVSSLIGIAALAYTVLKFIFENKHGVESKAQAIGFIGFLIFADIITVLGMCFFSPGRPVDKSLIISYGLIIFGINGLVYGMMHIDGRQQAKRINEKLSQYNGTKIE